MNFNVNVGVGAVFKLIVRKADTDEIVLSKHKALSLLFLSKECAKH